MEENMYGKVLHFEDGTSSICNVAAVLKNVKTGEKRVHWGANLVTTEGDKYYAEAAVGAPSWAVGGIRLGIGTLDPPAKGDTDVETELAGGEGEQVIDATYPKVSDTDGDNTGSGPAVVSWRVTYDTNSAIGANITELALVDSITAPTKALTRVKFSAQFTKTTNDTLKVFVNHTFQGV